MIEKFNGIFLLIIFILHFIGHGVYGFRCVFKTKSFLDQYAMHDSGAIMTRFFGSIFIASFIMAMYIMFVRSGGVDGTWGFFNLIFLKLYLLPLHPHYFFSLLIVRYILKKKN